MSLSRGSTSGNNQGKKKTKQKYDNDIIGEIQSGQVRSIGNYTLGATIGEGSFGKVKQAVHRLTGLAVAIKIVDRIHHPTLIREIETWRHLIHPHVAQLYEVIITEDKIYMVMEVCPHGELFDRLAKHGPFQESIARKWTKQIAEAINDCHKKHFVHRDLKLENILLSQQDDVKIIDFGFTRGFEENDMLDTYCGSTAYAAPEMIAGSKYIGPQADVWSLGIIIYALVCGNLPFDDDLETIVHQKIQDVDYHLPAHLSEACRELIASILQRDAAARPTVDQILQHTWLQTDVESSGDSLPVREEGSKGITLKRQTVKPDLAILTNLSSSIDESTSPLSALTPFLANNQSESLSVSSSSSSLLSPVSTPSMGSMKRAGHANTHKLCFCLKGAGDEPQSLALTDEEETLYDAFALIGIDASAVLRSVRSHACDSLSALWHLSLKKRQQVKEEALNPLISTSAAIEAYAKEQLNKKTSSGMASQEALRSPSVMVPQQTLFGGTERPSALRSSLKTISGKTLKGRRRSSLKQTLQLTVPNTAEPNLSDGAPLSGALSMPTMLSSPLGMKLDSGGSFLNGESRNIADSLMKGRKSLQGVEKLFITEEDEESDAIRPALIPEALGEENEIDAVPVTQDAQDGWDFSTDSSLQSQRSKKESTSLTHLVEDREEELETFPTTERHHAGESTSLPRRREPDHHTPKEQGLIRPHSSTLSGYSKPRASSVSYVQPLVAPNTHAPDHRSHIAIGALERGQSHQGLASDGSVGKAHYLTTGQHTSMQSTSTTSSSSLHFKLHSTSASASRRLSISQRSISNLRSVDEMAQTNAFLPPLSAELHFNTGSHHLQPQLPAQDVQSQSWPRDLPSVVHPLTSTGSSSASSLSQVASNAVLSGYSSGFFTPTNMSRRSSSVSIRYNVSNRTLPAE